MNFYQNLANQSLSTIFPSTSYWSTKILHLTMITSEYAYMRLVHSIVGYDI